MTGVQTCALPISKEENGETLDKIKDFVKEGGEKAKEAAEQGAEGDPLEAGAAGVGALGKAYIGMHTHAGALKAAAGGAKQLKGEKEKKGGKEHAEGEHHHHHHGDE